MTITVTQEEYEIRSISPVLINPSIVEGRNIYSSILGPGRAVTIVRYAPVFIENPLLTGSPVIPATLTCSAGVVDASPAPLRQYIWKVDGVTVVSESGPGANEFVTDLSHYEKVITCQVIATNVLGSATATSNGIEATIIEPINVMENDYYFVSGVSTQDAESVYFFANTVVTGIPVDDYVTNFSLHSMMLTGLGTLDHSTMFDYDVYVVSIPTYRSIFTITNPGAESGSTTGWTTTTGTFLSTAGSSKAGSRYFTSSGNALTIANQDLTVDSGDHTLIDASNMFVSLSFYATNNTSSDTSRDPMKFYLKCFDGSSNLLNTIDAYGTFTPETKGGSNKWEYFSQFPELIPPLTRTIQIVIEFLASSGGNLCQVDEISVKLYATT